ncbi:SET domain-containing protein SmydA-8-like isoform X1 [Tribolium madens]|uniref:SET domain-containing protein SmydA-8-like isoform X1 n=1 Tax=Tribolium madens TaxID=41895 RepID=UPI001CF761AA|nr:SET domain-containing protein SmydA-8-like isoform X1 [Tribolium madens]
MVEPNSFFRVAKNEIFGRFIIASKNIQQGQLIFKENPAVLCPQVGGPIICFNCCAQLRKLFFCPDCRVAVLCNPNCKSQFHNAQECTALKTLPLNHDDILSNPEIVTPLRCLLWRQFDKNLLENFLQLEAHLNFRRESQIWRRNRVNIEDVLFKLKILDENDLRDDVVQKICGILDINTFDVRQPQRNRLGFNQSENLRGLYLKAALMAHDCVANTHLAVDDDFVLYVHAAVDIPEGSPIYFNYTDVLQGNDERKRRLLNAKHFECQCLRCRDCTEFDTEMSSLKCPRCHKGLLRPKPWQCSSCQRIFQDSLIKMTITECQRRIEEFESPTIEALEKFLKKLSFTFHHQHYLVLEVEQNLVRLYSQASPSGKNLNRKIELCNKLLEIFRKIEPGISRIQAIAMYELHSAVANLAQKCYNNKEFGTEEFVKRLLAAETILKNSIKYLLYEPVKSPEGRLAQNALSELKMLRLSINNIQLGEKQTKPTKNKRKK